MDDEKDPAKAEEKPKQTLAERLAKYPDGLGRLTIVTGGGPITIIGVGVPPEEPEEAKTDESKQEPKP
ncbi:MAG: hypothetical protein NTW96_04045 [Planctomycetia bacterium]|nr:hypothetical protein [Planctomycetia bacterium]